MLISNGQSKLTSSPVMHWNCYITLWWTILHEYLSSSEQNSRGRLLEFHWFRLDLFSWQNWQFDQIWIHIGTFQSHFPALSPPEWLFFFLSYWTEKEERFTVLWMTIYYHFPPILSSTVCVDRITQSIQTDRQTDSAGIAERKRTSRFFSSLNSKRL